MLPSFHRAIRAIDEKAHQRVAHGSEVLLVAGRTWVRAVAFPHSIKPRQILDQASEQGNVSHAMCADTFGEQPVELPGTGVLTDIADRGRSYENRGNVR